MSGVLGLLLAGGTITGTITISNQNVSNFGNDPQTVLYEIRNTGAVLDHDGALETWLMSGAAADYDVRVVATDVVGGLDGSATSTWLNLGTTRSWSMTENLPDSTESCTLTVEIRDVATLTIQDTATVTLNVTTLP